MLLPDTWVDEWVIALALLLTALGVIARFSWKGYKGIKRIESVLGTDEKGRTLSQRMDEAELQLAPNGGASLVDRVKKIETNQVANNAELGVIRRMLAQALGHPHEDGVTDG